MDCASGERCVRQKIVQIENGVARVANTKRQLRANADLVRNAIRTSFGHQLSCLRSREHQLLEHVDTVVNIKLEILCEQQEQLHQALGSCKQLVESAEQYGMVEAGNWQSQLARLNGVSVSPREGAAIAFEADMLALRRQLQTFGRVTSKQNVKESETLPMDFEEYDDFEVPNYHKSFSARIGCAAAGTECSTKNALADGRNNADDCQSGVSAALARSQLAAWLAQVQSQTESEPVVFGDALSPFAPLAGCPYGDEPGAGGHGAIAAGGAAEPFRAFFQQISASPASEWLRGGADERRSEITSFSELRDHADDRRRTVSVDGSASYEVCSGPKGNDQCSPADKRNGDEDSKSLVTAVLTPAYGVLQSDSSLWLSGADHKQAAAARLSAVRLDGGECDPAACMTRTLTRLFGGEHDSKAKWLVD